MVIDTKTTDWLHVSQSIISILRHRNPLRCFVIVCNYIFSSFKCFELSFCSSTDFDDFSGNREQMNIPLVPEPMLNPHNFRWETALGVQSYFTIWTFIESQN